MVFQDPDRAAMGEGGDERAQPEDDRDARRDLPEDRPVREGAQAAEEEQREQAGDDQHPAHAGPVLALLDPADLVGVRGGRGRGLLGVIARTASWLIGDPAEVQSSGGLIGNGGHDEYCLARSRRLQFVQVQTLSEMSPGTCPRHVNDLDNHLLLASTERSES